MDDKPTIYWTKANALAALDDEQATQVIMGEVLPCHVEIAGGPLLTAWVVRCSDAKHERSYWL